jgi:hypothetical protein
MASRPFSLRPRGCTERERHYHSFVGEAGAGRWSIGQNGYQGVNSFGFATAGALAEILEYDGSIHMIRRWARNFSATIIEFSIVPLA